MQQSKIAVLGQRKESKLESERINRKVERTSVPTIAAISLHLSGLSFSKSAMPSLAAT
jgi:hypothetical protein